MADNGQFRNYGSLDQPSVALNNPAYENPEFTSLCDSITSNIYIIQKSASNLTAILQQIQSHAYTYTLRNRIQEIQHKTNPVVSTTTHYFQRVTNMTRSGQKHQKLQVERLKDKFQETVQRFSNTQKQIAEKIRTAVLKSEAMSPVTDLYEADDHDQTHLLEQEAEKKLATKQIENELENEYSLLLDREQRMHQIESDILDVNEIFRDLAAMVHEQGETVDTLENHIEEATGNVEQGAHQLIQASRYQKKYRQKLCWLLLLLLTITVIIVVVVVVETK